MHWSRLLLALLPTILLLGYLYTSRGRPGRTARDVTAEQHVDRHRDDNDLDSVGD